MDKAQMIKVGGQIALIAVGITAGLMLHGWVSPMISKATTKPLESTQE